MKITITCLPLLLFGLLLTTAPCRAAEQPRIAFIPGQTTDPFYISVYHGAKRAADALGIELIFAGSPQWDVTEQIAVLNKVIKENPTVIMISPTDTKQLIAPLKKAHDQGIKIITLDTYIGDGKYRDGHGAGDFPYTNISSDNVYGGRMAAVALAKSIGERGTVYIVKGSPASTTEMREYGFKKEMRRHRGIKILKTMVCREDTALAARQLQRIYTDHPDLKGVFGADLFSALGAADGIKAVAMTGKIKVVAIDATREIATAIRDGRIDTAITQHPEVIGYYGLMSAYGLITGMGAPLKIDTGFSAINAANIADPEISKYIYADK